MAAAAGAGVGATERMREHLVAERKPIFSFILNKEDFGEDFSRCVDLVNQRLHLLLAIEENRIQPTLVFLYILKQQLGSLFSELEAIVIRASPDSKKHLDAYILILHINFMTAYLMFRFCSPPDISGVLAFEMDKNFPSSACYWYKAHAVFFIHDLDSSYTNFIFSELVNCLQYVPDAYKENLAVMMLRRFNKCKDYFDASILPKLHVAYPRLIELDIADIPVIRARHEHTMQALNGSDYAPYFCAHKTDFSTRLDKKEPRNIIVERLASARVFPRYVPTQMQCNRYDLLKFIAHLGIIADLAFSFGIEGVPENVSHVLDAHISEGLVESGFLNSSALIVEAKVLKRNAVGEAVVAPEFIARIKELYDSFHLPGLTLLPFTDDYAKALSEQIIRSYVEHKQRRENLSKFHELNALFLFRQTLLSIPDPYPVAPVNLSRDQLSRVIALVDDCFSLKAMVESILTSKSTFKPEEHKALFDRMALVIRDFKDRKLNLIIPTGVPILTGTQSAHTFYIVIEFEEKEAGSSFRIHIFNGGPGLEYHRRYDRLLPSEFVKAKYGVYHTVGSKSIPLDAAGELFLQNYLYKALSLPYLSCGGDKAIQDLWLQNVYLGKEDGVVHDFQGYGVYHSAAAFRAPVAIRHCAQLSENCTTFNLKQALKIAAGLGDLEAGDLENLLLYGALELLKKVLSPSATPASGEAAGGAGASSAYSGSGAEFEYDGELMSPLVGFVCDEMSPTAAVAMPFQSSVADRDESFFTSKP